MNRSDLTLLKKTISDLYDGDVYEFDRIIWPDYAGKVAVSDQIEWSRDAALDLVAKLEKGGSETPEFDAAWHARNEVYLAALDALLQSHIAPHLRLAKLQGLKKSVNVRTEDLEMLERMPTVEAIETAKDYVEYAEKAAEGIKKLASRPKKYAELASHLAIEMKNMGASAGLDGTLDDFAVLSLKDADDFLAKLRASSFWGEGGKIANAFEAIAKFLGPVITALEIVGVVFAAIAKSNDWAQVLAKGMFAVGAGVALGVLVSSASVEAAIGSALVTIFTAAGITAEVPPAAIVLAGAGIVIAATFVVVEAFNFLIDWIFDLSGDISAMGGPMAMPMGRSMGLPMAQSMGAGMTD